MAAIRTTPRVINKRREKITALPLYHHGYLLKKYTGEKDFKNFFAELRGSTVFLYEADEDETYSERVELQNMKAMQIETPYPKSGPSVYTLTLLNEEVQLKFDNLNAAEQWRGYIITVATLEIPSKLQLLPGQIMKLEQVLEEECQRSSRLPTHVPILPCPPRSSTPPCKMSSSTNLADVPSCFYPVSRQEAGQMLEENADYGSLILRPAADSNNYAITMRQIFPSGPVIKHYKVRSDGVGFCIELDEPVTVPSLQGVLDHFLKETSHAVRPYVQPQPYDTRIVVPTNVAASPKTSALPVRPTPRGRLAPVIHTRAQSGLPPIPNKKPH